MLTWMDPVHDLHMRTKSDIVMIYSGILMYEDNVTIWQSSDTKDYLTPDSSTGDVHSPCDPAKTEG